MKNKSPQVDAYIAKAPAFARPVLERLRRSFHRACPQIEETIKWGTPHFEYKGLVAGMAAFKKHVSFGFWKGALLKDPEGLFKDGTPASMCAVKLTSESELPPDRTIIAYIKEAVKLNEDGVKLPSQSNGGKKKKTVRVPAGLKAALAKNAKARKTFDSLSYSHRREYVEWITQAKRPETRAKRLKTTLDWLAQGKSRNWKYQKC